MTSTKLNGRLAQWVMFLQQFNLTLCNRPGFSNNNVDGRQAWATVDDCDEDLTPSKAGEMLGHLLGPPKRQLPRDR